MRDGETPLRTAFAPGVVRSCLRIVPEMPKVDRWGIDKPWENWDPGLLCPVRQNGNT